MSAGVRSGGRCSPKGIGRGLVGPPREAASRHCRRARRTWRLTIAPTGRREQSEVAQSGIGAVTGPGFAGIPPPKDLAGHSFGVDGGLVGDQSDGEASRAGGLTALRAASAIVEWEAGGPASERIGWGDGEGVDARVCVPAGAITKGATSARAGTRRRSWASEILSAVVREARKDWGILRSDFSSGVYPGWIFTAAAFMHAGAVDSAVLAGSLVYFTLYLYQFCMPNQLMGLQEDKINKPWRPLPSRQMTIRGGWVRYGIAMLSFGALGQALGVLPETLMWQTSSFVHNVVGGQRHYLYRSFNIMVGVYAQLAAAWGMVTVISPIVWRWIWATALVSFVYSNIQDLRDVQGDIPMNRCTMPIAFGLTISCRAMAAILAISAPILHHFLVAPLPPTIFTRIFQVVGNGLCWLIAARMVLDETPAALQTTYEYYIHHYGWLLVGAFLLPGAAAAI
eukprot:evm.model.scf_1668.3 EVM.evm.TU.scf_1668.3   scf_1668:11792-13150(+)